ncbi:MAG: hypothetical protein ACXVRS_09265 [Gaiellaceae bacterium]
MLYGIDRAIDRGLDLVDDVLGFSLGRVEQTLLLARFVTGDDALDLLGLAFVA